MFPVIITITIPAALSGIAAIAFAVIAAGIRQADRSRLTSDPASSLDDDELDTPGYRPASGWKHATGTGVAPDIRPPARVRKPNRTTKGQSWR